MPSLRTSLYVSLRHPGARMTGRNSSVGQTGSVKMLWKVQAGGGRAVPGGCFSSGRRSCRFHVAVLRRSALRVGEVGGRKLAEGDDTSGIVWGGCVL